MKSHVLIRKESGELESFSRYKLANSLGNSGASKAEVDAILDDIESWLQDGVSSRKIRERAFYLLRHNRLGLAARYRLKKAMMELGPTGYPFEILIGEVFRRLGYEVEVGKTLNGHCVTHEVDVLARKGNDLYFIECKYYQHTGKNANVQVPMYIRSRVGRFDSIPQDTTGIRKHNLSWRGIHQYAIHHRCYLVWGMHRVGIDQLGLSRRQRFERSH